MQLQKADAHVHFFEHGYAKEFGARPGVSIQDAAVYESLAETHHVTDALVVGYEAEAFAAGNNDYLANLPPTRFRAHRLAFVKNIPALDRDMLNAWRSGNFEGIVFYVFDDGSAKNLQKVEPSTWRWLIENGWPISVNSRGPFWKAFGAVLKRFPELTVLVSHMGLPPAMEKADRKEAAKGIAPTLELAGFANVHVKLSAFYAASRPSHDYPHETAWPYVELLLEAFGIDRLMWGSDFAPHLEHVSFPQTFDLFSRMSFLSDGARKKIMRDNLMKVLRASRNAPACRQSPPRQ